MASIITPAPDSPEDRCNKIAEKLRASPAFQAAPDHNGRWQTAPEQPQQPQQPQNAAQSASDKRALELAAEAFRLPEDDPQRTELLAEAEAVRDGSGVIPGLGSTPPAKLPADPNDPHKQLRGLLAQQAWNDRGIY